jgi:hypothetical protein
MKIPSPETIAKSFDTEFKPGATSRISWDEARRLGEERGICGEIRSDADVGHAKKDAVLRAVYVPDAHGGAIRWADPQKMIRVLSGIGHEYLSCTGDAAPPTREGYIVVGSDGTVRVTNKNGK